MLRAQSPKQNELEIEEEFGMTRDQIQPLFVPAPVGHERLFDDQLNRSSDDALEAPQGVPPEVVLDEMGAEYAVPYQAQNYNV